MSLFQDWPDACVLVDESGVVVSANSAARSFFSHAEGELTDLAFEDLLQDVFRRPVLAACLGLRQNDGPDSGDSYATFKRVKTVQGPTEFDLVLEAVKINRTPGMRATFIPSDTASIKTLDADYERRCLGCIGQLAAHADDFQSREQEFGRLVRKLVPGDSVLIATMDEDGKTAHILYADHSGLITKDALRKSARRPIAGTTIEDVLASGKATVRNFINHRDFRNAYPGSGRGVAVAGLRAVLNIPLIAGGEIFGFLIFRSSGQTVYTAEDLRLGQAIASLIASSAAQLDMRRRKSRADHENRILTSIGQVLASNIETEKVFQSFAELVSELLTFDLIAIHRLEHQSDTEVIDHLSARGPRTVHTRRPGSRYPAAWTMMDRHRDAASPVLILFDRPNEMLSRYPGSASSGGSKTPPSTILVPLLRTPSFNAALLIQSSQPEVYSEADFAIAEKIGMALKGPVASAYVQIREQELERERERNVESESERKRLAELSEAKTEFLSMLSHELKTPLTSITAFAGLLHANKNGNLGDRELQQVDAIRRNSRLLEVLITDLLDLSKMESGRLTVAAEVVIPSQLVRECVAELEGVISERSQRINVEIEDEEMTLIADSQRLRQVLMNLVGNASKYSPLASTITINGRVEAGLMTISVRDEGPGVPEADQHNVFQLFNRGMKTTAQQQQPGTGIGLYVAKKIVEAHGGEISLRSHPSGGAVAQFSIPLAPAAPVTEGRAA